MNNNKSQKRTYLSTEYSVLSTQHLVLCTLYFVLFSLLTAQRSPASEIPAKKQEKPIALVGGTIHTVSGDVISNGTIVFDNGKITALGANVSLPQNAERVDVKGKKTMASLCSTVRLPSG